MAVEYRANVRCDVVAPRHDIRVSDERLMDRKAVPTEIAVVAQSGTRWLEADRAARTRRRLATTGADQWATRGPERTLRSANDGGVLADIHVLRVPASVGRRRSRARTRTWRHRPRRTRTNRRGRRKRCKRGASTSNPWQRRQTVNPRSAAVGFRVADAGCGSAPKSDGPQSCEAVTHVAQTASRSPPSPHRAPASTSAARVRSAARRRSGMPARAGRSAARA